MLTPTKVLIIYDLKYKMHWVLGLTCFRGKYVHVFHPIRMSL